MKRYHRSSEHLSGSSEHLNSKHYADHFKKLRKQNTVCFIPCADDTSRKKRRAIQSAALYYGKIWGYRVTTFNRPEGVLVIRHEDRERRKRK